MRRPVARKPLSQTRAHAANLSNHPSVDCCSSCSEDVWPSGGALLCGCPSFSVWLSFCPLCSFYTDRPGPMAEVDLLHLRPPWTAKNVIVFVCLFNYFSSPPFFPGHAFSRVPININWTRCSLRLMFSASVLKLKTHTNMCLSNKPVDERSSTFLYG